ncbi:unnamed protein product [Oreochromis niloticus]|nr:unnamed protein product [Mustela putorius furo]
MRTMFKCFICQTLHSTSQALISHLRLGHSFYPSTKFKLACSQDGCSCQFTTYSGLKKHLNSVHDEDCCQSGDAEPSESFQADFDRLQDTDIAVAGTSVTQSLEVGCSENNGSGQRIKKNSEAICTKIIGKLNGSGLANSFVSSLVCDLEDFADGLHCEFKHKVLNVVPTENPVRSPVEKCLETFDNPVEKFDTEAKRKSYFREKWGIVDPVEKTLGIRYDTRLNKKSGTYDQVPVKDTFVYIPILETIKFICRNSYICELLAKLCVSKEDRYEDFCDGSYYKSHPLFSKPQTSLQIQLYYDDFETANPLGSKRGVHKVGAIYFVLRNLPPKLNSALMNIHLVALFHAEDVKKYGFDPILQPLIDDIKFLESHGIDLPFSSEKVHGTICQITGDNLGMHSILGFVESFSGRYFCRLCLIAKQDAQSVYTEDDPKIILRGKELFEMHCSELQSDPQKLHVFGLRKNSTLNTLQFFHVCQNFSLDIMHDILEGVAQYEIKLLLEYLSDNFLPKPALLSRIYAFDYGYLESKNRPTRVNLDSSGNSIGLNSIQTLCLIRNIPLIFGDIVPEGNQNWTMLLLLLQIINIIFSPSVTHGMTVLLKHLTMEHHDLFKLLYPGRNMIPKHHFMLHYPTCIRKIGPLLHVWSMRGEAKHRVFKDTLKNFKNITVSLAKKHQTSIAYKWETCPLSHVEYGPLKSFDVDSEENSEMISLGLPAVAEEAFSANWVNINGTEYRTGLVICCGSEHEMPVFCRIKTIVLVNSHTYFIVQKLVVENFSEHCHAYKVFETDEKDVVKADCIEIYKPFDLQSAYGDDDGLYTVPLFLL